VPSCRHYQPVVEKSFQMQFIHGPLARWPAGPQAVSTPGISQNQCLRRQFRSNTDNAKNFDAQNHARILMGNRLMIGGRIAAAIVSRPEPDFARRRVGQERDVLLRFA
jgi:hypothetical protein